MSTTSSSGLRNTEKYLVQNLSFLYPSITGRPIKQSGNHLLPNLTVNHMLLLDNTYVAFVIICGRIFLQGAPKDDATAAMESLFQASCELMQTQHGDQLLQKDQPTTHELPNSGGIYCYDPGAPGQGVPQTSHDQYWPVDPGRFQQGFGGSVQSGGYMQHMHPGFQGAEAGQLRQSVDDYQHRLRTSAIDVRQRPDGTYYMSQ